MISTANISTKSIDILKLRGLTDQQVTNFAELLDKAKAKQENNVSAKQILSSMSNTELQLIQKASSLADPIQVSKLSKEGAMNLFAQPDRSGMVDLNNDGIVEVGEAKGLMFPPVNAPSAVKDAWEKATQGLSEQEKLMLEIHAYDLTYGLTINDGLGKEQVPVSEQWSVEGIKQWFIKARDTLEFSVQHQGWTKHNLLLKDFYNNFEAALATGV